MTNIHESVLILFPPGYFGHYLYWVMNNFTELGDHTHPKFPVNSVGNSHKQNGGESIHAISSWKDYRNLDSFSKFGMCHGHLTNNNDISEISNTVNTCIVINPHNDFYLAHYDMYFDKSGQKYDLSKLLSKDVINQIDLNTDPVFKIREFISYKLFHHNKYIYSNNLTNNIVGIDIFDLIYNFAEVFNGILEFLNTSSTASVETIMENHNKMLTLQKHLTKDKDINYFLECFTNNIECNMPLYSTIIDEAYVQKYLRDILHLEIKCDDLNIFPISTTELHKITYSAEEMIRLE